MEGTAVKRLALLALLLASSALVAAPAPLPKPQRKAERPAPARKPARLDLDGFDVVVVVNLGVVAQPINAVVIGAAVQAPAQPPNADPPG
jgi:hypothetical protein